VATRNNRTPRPQLYTPSLLSLYQGCPERYRLAKVERQRVVEPFSPALGRGKTIHGVLAECLVLQRHFDVRTGLLPANGSLVGRERTRLGTEEQDKCRCSTRDGA